MKNRRLAAVLGLACLSLTAGSAAALASPAPAPAERAATTGENLPGVPTKGAPAQEWEAWAAKDRAGLEATDWHADSATRGCELLEVSILDEVDPGYNAAMGAPLNLVTARAERAEKCPEFESRQTAASDEFSVMAVPAGPQCNSQTQGPGTICISKGSNRIEASFNYRGTGSINGYIRIYQIDPATNGCPTGSTFQTGSTLNYVNGTTRTTGKTQTQNGAYSAHFWRETGTGTFTNWGRTCGLF